MRLIFEHLIVNGYVIDVYGEVWCCSGEELYYVMPDFFYITKDGFRFSSCVFFSSSKLKELFWKTLNDTEDQYQDYLRNIYHGYQN